MVDILDVVVPAYSAGITVDLLDYHKINGKKTVDKYVDIQQEQLEEVISYWDDERELKQATYFAPENGNPGRVVVVMCSFNYNYSDTFEKWTTKYKEALEEIANICAIAGDMALVNGTKERSDTAEPVFIDIQEKSSNPIEALHDMWFGKKEKPEHEDAIDALRYAINKSLADTIGMPVELLDPDGPYGFDTESGKLTNAQHEEMKNILHTMAMSGPEDIEKQVEQWRDMIDSSDISHEGIDKFRERIKEATYVDDATKQMEKISAATGLPLDVVKSMYLGNRSKEENNGCKDVGQGSIH